MLPASFASRPCQLSDEQLVAIYKKAKGSRHEALEALTERYAPVVYRQAYRMLQNEDEAMDVVQEVGIRVMRFLDEFDERSKFSTWLYRITENQCLSQLERNAKRASLYQALSLESVLPEGQAGAQDDTIEAVRQAIGHLSQGDRNILELRFYRELSLEDLANTLGGISFSACKMRFYRAQKRFCETYQEEYPAAASSV